MSHHLNKFILPILLHVENEHVTSPSQAILFGRPAGEELGVSYDEGVAAELVRVEEVSVVSMLQPGA